MSDTEKELSYLNKSFCFKKTSNSSDKVYKTLEKKNE